MTNVTVGNRVTSLGDGAFEDCSHLLRVTLPNSLTNIGDWAFSGCSVLSGITLPSRVTHLGDMAFWECSRLQSISVAALNPAYSSVAGVLFDRHQKTLLLYPPGRAGSYTVPDGVTTIGSLAFNSCSALTSVRLPASVRNIAGGAFSSCANLTQLTVGPGLTSIGWNAFAGCPRLAVAYFQGNAPSVDTYAFEEDPQLTVYYRSGTQGWEESFGGCPTALWNGRYTIAVSAAATEAGRVSGGGTFVGGHSQMVRAAARPGYLFINWTENEQEVSTAADYSFTLLGDRNLVAHFAANPFPPVAGTYHGLISSLTPTNAGCFTLTVTARGLGSGTLQLGGARYAFSGRFDPTGRLLARLPADQPTLTVTLQLDVTTGTESVSGTVASPAGYTALLGDRAGFNARTHPATNYTGRYTAIFPRRFGPTNAPTGDSWATLAVTPSGWVCLSAALSDGTKLTQAAPLSQDGVWPLYAALDERQGLLQSWLSFTNTLTNDLSGHVLWVKPKSSSTAYYPEGFNLFLIASGSRYLPPDGSGALDLTNAALVLSGAGLAQDLTNYVTLQPNNLVSSTNGTRLTFRLATGAFQGSVPAPGNPSGQRLSFSGVVLQKQHYGDGWVRGTNQCGQLSLGLPDSPL